MSDEDSETPMTSIEEVRSYHLHYLRAINNPLRREILRALKAGEATIEGLQSRTGLHEDVLEWHLDILEKGKCVKKEEREGKTFYRLTREGEVVDYLG